MTTPSADGPTFIRPLIAPSRLRFSYLPPPGRQVCDAAGTAVRLCALMPYRRHDRGARRRRASLRDKPDVLITMHQLIAQHAITDAAPRFMRDRASPDDADYRPSAAR